MNMNVRKLLMLTIAFVTQTLQKLLSLDGQNKIVQILEIHVSFTTKKLLIEMKIITFNVYCQLQLLLKALRKLPVKVLQKVQAKVLQKVQVKHPQRPQLLIV